MRWALSLVFARGHGVRISWGWPEMLSSPPGERDSSVSWTPLGQRPPTASPLLPLAASLCVDQVPASAGHAILVRSLCDPCPRGLRAPGCSLGSQIQGTLALSPPPTPFTGSKGAQAGADKAQVEGGAGADLGRPGPAATPSPLGDRAERKSRRERSALPGDWGERRAVPSGRAWVAVGAAVRESWWISRWGWGRHPSRKQLRCPQHRCERRCTWTRPLGTRWSPTVSPRRRNTNKTSRWGGHPQ